MVLIYGGQYRVTYAELCRRKLPVLRVHENMKKLIKDGVHYENTKVISNVFKHGKDLEEIHWQYGLDLQATLAKVKHYIAKPTKNTNVTKWKSFLAVLENIEKELNIGTIVKVENQDNAIASYFRIDI